MSDPKTAPLTREQKDFALEVLNDDSGKYGEGFKAEVAAMLRRDQDANPDPSDIADGGAPDGEAPNPHITVLPEVKIEGEATPDPTTQPSAAEAAGRGLAHGATLGWGERGAAATESGLESLLGDPTAAGDQGIPREYAEGSPRAAMLRQMQRDSGAARKAHPYVFGGTSAVGSMPLAIASSALLPGSAGLGARMAFSGAQGGAMGGIEAKGQGASNEDAAKQALFAALLGAGGTGVLGGLAQYARGAAARGSEFAAEKNAAADVQRLRAVGATKPQIDRMGDTSRYAQAAEELRTDQPWYKRVLPRNARFYADKADEAASVADMDKSRIEGELAQAPVTGSQIANGFRGQQASYSTIEGAPFRDALEQKAATYEQQFFPQTFKNGVNELQTLGEQGKWDALNPSPSQQVRAKAYGSLNETLADAGNDYRAGAGDAWRAAKEQQHRMIMLGDIAEGRELRDATNRIITPSDYMIGGAELAAGNPKAAIVSAATNHLLSGREHDALASLQRMRAKLNSAGADALASFAEGPGATISNAAQTPAGQGVIASGAAAAPGMAQDDLSALLPDEEEQARLRAGQAH